MTGFLACAGVLAVLSGLVKLLGKGRQPGTLPLIPLLEFVAGLGGLYVGIVYPPSPLVGGGMSALLVSLVLISTLSRARRFRAQRRHRELTEEARLATYVQYLSSRPQEEEGASEPPTPPSPESDHSPGTDR